MLRRKISSFRIRTGVHFPRQCPRPRPRHHALHGIEILGTPAPECSSTSAQSTPSASRTPTYVTYGLSLAIDILLPQLCLIRVPHSPVQSSTTTYAWPILLILRLCMHAWVPHSTANGMSDTSQRGVRTVLRLRPIRIATVPPTVACGSRWRSVIALTLALRPRTASARPRKDRLKENRRTGVCVQKKRAAWECWWQ